MSYYLVERIKAQPNIEVLTRSEVTALEGCDGNLENGALAPLRAAESRSVLDERALVCGRHIFGWYFPFRVAQLRDARARGGKLSNGRFCCSNIRGTTVLLSRGFEPSAHFGNIASNAALAASHC